MKEDILKRNNVTILGKGGKTMLFAHGFGCDQNMWRFLIPAFKEEAQIILFDYVGAGKSDLSSYNLERYSTLEGYALDVLEICEALKLSDITFIGHSVSSMIGLIAAIERPSYFSNLVMVAPSPCYINKDNYIGGFERRDIDDLLDTMERNYQGWANFLAPQIMKNQEKPELTQELTESFCSLDPRVAQQFARATFLSDNRDDLHKLKIPSLILQCSDDLIAPLSVGTYLHENLRNSILRIMKATGHCPHMSSPEETILMVKDYLRISA